MGYIETLDKSCLREDPFDFYAVSLAIANGAKRVVVSLWSVNDAATSQLMQKYYQQMLQKGLNPVEALTTAQLEMWRSQLWQPPYYWGAFVVQNEWSE